MVIHNASSIRSISSLLVKQTSETLQNYMIAYFIASQAFHIFAELRNISKAAGANDYIITNDESRSRRCAKYVSKNMQDAVTKIYIEKYHDKYARNEVFSMTVLHTPTLLFCIFSDDRNSRKHSTDIY